MDTKEIVKGVVAAIVMLANIAAVFVDKEIAVLLTPVSTAIIAYYFGTREGELRARLRKGRK